MRWARNHARLFSILAFCLLALVAELVGRALTASVDVGRHVHAPGNAAADYYPFLLAGVKVCIALMLARLAWRVTKARATADAARRAVGGTRLVGRAPRPRLRLSPRLWLGFFAVTSCMYLVQMDAEWAAAGRWPLLAPWLHTSALPVFAVLSVLLAVLWHAVQQWLAAYEQFAAAAAEQARRGGCATSPEQPRTSAPVLTPRALHGLAFESRPPPLPA
jgi:hypothetical protein